MAELGVTRGCGDGTGFCPDRNVTRAEMAVFLSRAYNLPDGPDPDFSRVQEFAAIHSLPLTGGEHRELLGHDFLAVSAGYLHSCGLLSDQTVTCSGIITYAPLDRLFLSVSAGHYYSCGVVADKTVTCWGNNEHGQSDAPAGLFSAVSAGGRHSCGLRADETVACWGDNEHGQSDAPAGLFSAVSAGHFHSCGLRADETVACWGSDLGGWCQTPEMGVLRLQNPRSATCGLWQIAI